MKKRLAGIILSVVMLAAGLTGCGSSDDAATYVKGLMDVAYNKGTEDYVEASGVKEADAKKYMEQSVEAECKIMAAYFGINNPSEEVIAEFKPVVEKMYESLEYEVKADSDKVKISANEVGIGLGEEAQQYLDDYTVKRYVDGDTTCTDETFAKEMAELLLKQMDKGSCATCDMVSDKLEITVTEKDGKFTISDEDLAKLDSELVVYIGE